MLVQMLVQMLEKKFQMIFLLKKDYESGWLFNVDADHAHDLVIRISITGFQLMLNNAPFRWTSKSSKTVETLTYDSELAA
jgi:hypothetical protein